MKYSQLIWYFILTPNIEQSTLPPTLDRCETIELADDDLRSIKKNTVVGCTGGCISTPLFCRMDVPHLGHASRDGAWDKIDAEGLETKRTTSLIGRMAPLSALVQDHSPHAAPITAFTG